MASDRCETPVSLDFAKCRLMTVRDNSQRRECGDHQAQGMGIHYAVRLHNPLL